MKINIGHGSSMHMNIFIFSGRILIGNCTTINRRCFLDGRGSICIGDNVSISPEVHLITADHDINSSTFEYRQKEIIISDYVFIGSRATILPGVKIGKGAIICAGAVVTKDIEEYGIYAGIPANKVGNRNKNLNYTCDWFMPFD
jgi:maltose O-acetyltransferase